MCKVILLLLPRLNYEYIFNVKCRLPLFLWGRVLIPPSYCKLILQHSFPSSSHIFQPQSSETTLSPFAFPSKKKFPLRGIYKVRTPGISQNYNPFPPIRLNTLDDPLLNHVRTIFYNQPSPYPHQKQDLRSTLPFHSKCRIVHFEKCSV